jgi:hypothetical protein
VKRERDADAGSGRPAKRRAPSGPPAAAAAAGGGNQGLDLDALTAMLNTPLARELGADGEWLLLSVTYRCSTFKPSLTAAAERLDRLCCCLCLHGIYVC